jgi:hypothetical protein
MKLTKKIYNLFTRHPRSVGESYFEHMREALTIASRMYFSFVGQTVHAFFPFIHPPNGTDIVTMKTFCHNHTPEERLRRKSKIIIKEVDTSYK